MTDESLFQKLSKREKEVVNLIAQGATNKEIANALKIGEGTVKSYIHNILIKCDVNDRRDIMILAINNKLVSNDTENT